MSFREKIDDVSKAKRLSQAAVAAEMKANPGQVNAWFRGDGMPSIENAVSLSRVLGVSMDYLFKDEVERPEDAGGPSLSPDEVVILRIVRKLGIAESLDRLWGGSGQNPPLVERVPPQKPRPTRKEKRGGKAGSESPAGAGS